MKKYLPAYFAMALLMILLDFIWLGTLAKPIYQQGIGNLMATQPNLIFAALFYIIYVYGLLVFALRPHAALKGFSKTAVTAALFGFIVYASYDLTNLAVLKNWPVDLALIDITWGVFISTVSTVAGKFVFDRLNIN